MRFAIAALMLAVTAGPAEAAFITANAAIDLNAVISGNQWAGYGMPLSSVAQVSSGDTVTINISFLPGQALTWNSNGYFNPWLLLEGWPGPIVDNNQSGSFNWSNLNATLTGLTQGTQFPAGQLVNGSSSAIHLGPTSVLGNDNVVRTFTGASVTFVATWSDGDPFRRYGTIGYIGAYLFNGRVEVTQAASPTVPEPTSLALAGFAGLGMAAGAWRRRRQQKQAA